MRETEGGICGHLGGFISYQDIKCINLMLTSHFSFTACKGKYFSVIDS